MSYGRIGTTRRSKVRSFATAADAQVQVHACLRKRATAPRRIGAAIVCGAQARPGLGPSPDSIIGFVHGSAGRIGAMIYHNVAGHSRRSLLPIHRFHYGLT